MLPPSGGYITLVAGCWHDWAIYSVHLHTNTCAPRKNRILGFSVISESKHAIKFKLITRKNGSQKKRKQ